MGALFYGGKVIVVPKNVAKDTAAFGDLLVKEKVTILNQTPSAFYILQDYVTATAPSVSVRYVIFGGEALTPRKIKPWKQHYPACRLINMYGITETTVHVTYQEIDWQHLDSPLSIIGDPIPTLQAYILDENRNMASVDVTGELYIGGAGLARGYLNRPDLTADRFIPNPFDPTPGERLYKTGDLARRLEDGNIEYLGRIDHQVKIRGFRIELGEIENVILQYPGIRNTVVIARDAHGDKQLIAYFLSDNPIDNKGLIGWMGTKLPDYMVPRLLMRLEKIPLTSNGKIDTKALPDPDASELLTNEFVKARNKTEQVIADLWQQLLNVRRVGTRDNFFELGGNSLLAVRTSALLKERHDITLPVTRIYQYPTVEGITSWLEGKQNAAAKKPFSSIPSPAAGDKSNTDIAIVSMAGRFPGADTIDQLWTLLKEGRESVTFFKKEELDPALPSSLTNDPDYVRARGILKNAAAFDASFFGIQPATAAAMDPQQRVFLEIAWEALEKAGCLPGKYPGRIGVFAGTGHNTYYLNNVFNNSAANDSIGSFQAMLVNDRDFIATRTAYQLDLKGPALSIHTACSTSLLAIAQAVDSLRRGQCEVALAGAASITSPINSGHLYQEGAMLSPDGHSNSFDADARGTVFSDGAGVVLLKSLDQARRDGDQILAVIKGTGVNNDGGGKGSFTAPSAEGQAGAIAMAIADAGIPASSISYVEAHGTATPLGDPIEIEGLQMAFHPQERTGFCAIGTIKSNMGHLTATSGVAGLIKTVLALQHRQLPPSINYRQPNPNIDFANSPFYVNTRLSDWNSDGPRRAGISSFGVGGTNVHVIVEEYPNAGDNAPDTSRSVGRPAQLITYSARSAASLEGYAAGLNRWLAETPESSLADIAATLQTTREDFPFRRYIVASTTSELASALASPPQSFTTSNLTKKEAAEVVFMFPGQGSQQTGMAKELYDHEPVFRQAVDECAEILNGMIGEDIRSILYPAAPDGSNEPRINETRFAQPALFVIEYALARLWISWGITPSAFIGHSVGEFVAAHLAGVFSLHDGLHLVSTRGKLMGDLPTGDMLGIRAPVDSILPILPADCSLAAINSPALCVVSGPNEAIGRFAADLQEKGIQNRLLHTSHAFHSAMMDPVLEPFGREVQSIQLNIPRIPIVSTVTGNWITEAEATSNDYWTLHLRSTVRFSPALVTLLEAPNRVLLEVGPRNVTTTLALQHSHVRPVIAIPSLGDPTSDKAAYPMLKALGLLYIHGIHPDWKAFYAGQNRRRPSLPTYSWDHKDYWLTPVNKPFTNNTTGAASVPEPSPAPQTQPTTPSTLQTFAMRKNALIEKLKTILENSSGIEMDGLQPDMSFIEVGLDSLLLTQIALSLKKEFSLPITFRQLSDQQGTLDSLASWIDANLPPDPAPAAQPAVQTPSLYQNQPTMNGFEPAGHAGPVNGTAVYNTIPPANANAAIGLIAQQIHLLAQQVALLGGGQPMPAPQPPAAQVSQPLARPQPVAQPAAPANGRAANEAGLSQEEIVELKKPFGATARIEKHATALSPEQHSWLNRLIRDYTAKTKASKDYTQQHRARMADPRVVSGFKPYTKEMVYSIVIERSKGSRLWDIDGNEYIDMLNGFGSNMLGYQPDFVAEAVKQQVDKGYEIGPQHVLAGEVTDLICEFTGFDRVGLCNTGSEAVLGAMRIARTVTGRSLIVAFTGSYHGIVDEVIVRGTKKLKSFPAASGIMPEAVQNMLILDYGTPESLAIIRERAHELAAVLIEPVQSRRPEFFPLEFLREVRKITEVSGTTPHLRRSDHRLPYSPRRNAGQIRHPRRHRHLWQSHRRRHLHRRHRRQTTPDGRPRRRILAIWRCVSSRSRRNLLRRHLCQTPACTGFCKSLPSLYEGTGPFPAGKPERSRSLSHQRPRGHLPPLSYPHVYSQLLLPLEGEIQGRVPLQ